MPHNCRAPHRVSQHVSLHVSHDAACNARDDSGKLHGAHTPCAPGCAAGGAPGNTIASTYGCGAASRAVPGCPRPHTGPARLLNALLGPLLCTAGLAVTLTTLLTGCGDKTPPGEVATMRACRICHGADRICADIGKLDRAGWEKTVDRMIAGGASVTPEERTAVIDWLAARRPGDKALCP